MRIEPASGPTSVYTRPRYTLSCIVPVFNQEEGIAQFLEDLHATTAPLADEVELLVVNDGSSDRSAVEILRCARRLPIHYIELSRRFGLEAALQAGLDAACGDCVLTLDGAARHRLPAIAEMVKRWNAGVEMVCGAGIDQFRLLDAAVVAALRQMPERNRSLRELYRWVGFKSEVIELPQPQDSDEQGMSRGLNSLFRRLNGIAASSITPLRCVTALGFSFSVLSLLMGCWIVLEKLLFGQAIPGFATLAAAVFFLSGVQLIALGVVGEYVGRIFEEVKRRPSYLVSRQSRHGSAAQPGNPSNDSHSIASLASQIGGRNP